MYICISNQVYASCYTMGQGCYTEWQGCYTMGQGYPLPIPPLTLSINQYPKTICIYIDHPLWYIYSHLTEIPETYTICYELSAIKSYVWIPYSVRVYISMAK